MHALDGGGGVLRHLDARAGRAGEADHVHAGVTGQGRAHARAVAVDHVEHARRDARRIHDLGPEEPRQGRDLGGFQHHGAADRQRRRDLAADLVRRPVPRGDEGADADGLAADQGGAARLLLERIVLEHRNRRLQMGHAHEGLSVAGQRRGGAHLGGDGLGHLVLTADILGQDGFQQIDPFLP
ncbi:hypothetical protein D3C87_1348390 [compost metagenome]